jgi:hypothetical protein
MRNLVICGLILLALSFNCDAIAPVQLSGSDGLAVLSQIAVPTQTNNSSTSTSLWDWGTIPSGYTVNGSGILTSFEYVNNGVWTPSI